MRLTIVDKQMNYVYQIYQVATLTPETFAQLREFGASFRHPGFAWFVTPAGEQPAGFRHDDTGQPIFDGKPVPASAS